MSLMRRRPRRGGGPLSRTRRGLLSQAFTGVPVDVVETDDEIVVRADLPGMKPEDIDVSIVGNRLRLKGESQVEEEGERGNTYFRERRYGRFQRYIDLPSSVDADAASAEFKNGVLKVALPKTAAMEQKKIEVKRPFEEI
jgi:HSP20 family protein